MLVVKTFNSESVSLLFNPKIEKKECTLYNFYFRNMNYFILTSTVLYNFNDLDLTLQPID